MCCLSDQLQVTLPLPVVVLCLGKMHRRILSSRVVISVLALIFILIMWDPAKFGMQVSQEPLPEKPSDWFFGNQNVEQTDIDVVKYLRANRLIPPSKNPFNLNVGATSQFQDILMKLFRNKKNGFFIECGANDGVFLSNTLYLERNQGWTGLLIESNKFILPALKTRNRNSWIAEVCLSLKPYPERVSFLHRQGDKDWFKGNGKIDEGNNTGGVVDSSYINAGQVECFPLFSLLVAINVTRVDYFSLDVEGAEYKILRNIPFNKIDIGVISVEANVIPEGASALIDLMKLNGYKVAFTKKEGDLHELFFVKNNNYISYSK